MKTIEIDFDIHKLIEAERTGFEEPEFVALRRLLGLPSENFQLSEIVAAKPEGRPFVEAGVSVAHGSEAQMFYLRGTQHYEGKFLDGYLVVNGCRYSSLSAAACDLARTKDGNKTSLNGWLYWEVREPGSHEWVPMQELRKNWLAG